MLVAQQVSQAEGKVPNVPCVTVKMRLTDDPHSLNLDPLQEINGWWFRVLLLKGLEEEVLNDITLLDKFARGGRVEQDVVGKGVD